MEINKVKYFRTVFEVGSMRRAAELIKMSSGSLSKSIKSLEDELGIKLFVPDGRNIIPTEEAKKVYLKSQDLIDSYTAFFSYLDDSKSKDQKKVIKIASWEVFSTYFISQFCADEIQKTDQVIEVLEKPPELLETSLINGEVDIGITYAPVAHPDLEFIKITKFNFNIYGRKSFQKLDFSNWPFAIPIFKIDNSVVGIKELDHWPKETLRHIKYKFEMLETALQTSRLGLSVIHCPSFIIGLQNKMLKKEFQLEKITPNNFPKSHSLDVFIATRKGFPENQLIKKLAKALRTYCQ